MLKPIVFALVTIAVLGLLWAAFKPPPHEPRAAVSAPAVPAPMASPASTSSGTVAAAAPEEKVFTFVVKNRRLVSGSPLMQVREGERVSVRVTTDHQDELHLHGYNLHATVAPEATATLAFVADRTGRFGLEFHKAHMELGALEVYPR